MNNDIKIKLKKLRDIIANEENAFSMEVMEWHAETIFPEDSYQGECGTPACILGWYEKLEGTENSAYSSNAAFFDSIVRDGYDLITHPEVYTKDGIVKTYSNHAEWFTRERTVAMLDHLIKTGKVDWEIIDE